VLSNWLFAVGYRVVAFQCSEFSHCSSLLMFKGDHLVVMEAKRSRSSSKAAFAR
jgi:hypothetical protein